jgi:hypothetical protein
LQVHSMRLELLDLPVAFVHGHILPSRSVIAVTNEPTRM